MSRIVLFDPKLTSPVNFNNFQAENFLILFNIYAHETGLSNNAKFNRKKIFLGREAGKMPSQELCLFTKVVTRP